MMTSAGWTFPERDAMFPIADEQHCHFCGNDDWNFVYLLLDAPQWVQELPWVINWFVAVCDSCNQAFLVGDDGVLAAARNVGDRLSAEHLSEVLKVIRVRMSEPPVARELAQLSP